MLPGKPHKRLILALRLTRFHVRIAFSELLEDLRRTLSPLKKTPAPSSSGGGGGGS